MEPLPELHQATLDLATLESLFDDVRHCGRDLEVIEKTAAQKLVAAASIGSGPNSLTTAYQSLTSGTCHSIQLRYDYQGQRWCDTLVAEAEGYRLTRICLPAVE